jgi:hypothetical protein
MVTVLTVFAMAMVVLSGLVTDWDSFADSYATEDDAHLL